MARNIVSKEADVVAVALASILDEIAKKYNKAALAGWLAGWLKHSPAPLQSFGRYAARPIDLRDTGDTDRIKSGQATTMAVAAVAKALSRRRWASLTA